MKRTILVILLASAVTIFGQFTPPTSSTTPVTAKSTGQVVPANVEARLAKADAALPASTYNANDILAKLITVDGAGKLLDADYLDGKSSADFVLVGNVNATYLNSIPSSGFATAAQGTKADAALPAASYTASDVKSKILTVDGPESTIDADLLDGISSSGFATAAQGTKADSAYTLAANAVQDVSTGGDLVISNTAYGAVKITERSGSSSIEIESDKDITIATTAGSLIQLGGALGGNNNMLLKCGNTMTLNAGAIYSTGEFFEHSQPVLNRAEADLRYLIGNGSTNHVLYALNIANDVYVKSQSDARYLYAAGTTNKTLIDAAIAAIEVSAGAPNYSTVSNLAANAVQKNIDQIIAGTPDGAYPYLNFENGVATLGFFKSTAPTVQNMISVTLAGGSISALGNVIMYWEDLYGEGLASSFEVPTYFNGDIYKDYSPVLSQDESDARYATIAAASNAQATADAALPSSTYNNSNKVVTASEIRGNNGMSIFFTSSNTVVITESN